jgi:MFS family permease
MDLSAYNAQLKQHHRWNYWWLLADTAAFSAISKILNPSVTLAYYLSFFTDSRVLFALIPALLTTGAMVSQLFWANVVNGMARKQTAWIVGTAVSRGAMVLFLAGTAFTASRGGVLPVWLFFLALAVYAFANGLVTPLWSNFVAKSFPDGRGRFLGYAYVLDGIIGVSGAYGMKLVLQRLPFPASFIWFFGFLAVFAVLTILPAVMFREVPYPVQAPQTPVWQTIRQIPAIMAGYPSYARYLGCRIVVTFAEMSSNFYTIHAIDTLSATGEHVATYTILMLLGGLVTNLIFGRLGDKLGFIRIMQLGFVIGLCNNVIVLLARSPEALYPVLFLQGAYMTAIILSVTNLNMATSPADQTALFVGLANALTGPFLALTPLLGALISHWIGFRALMWICIGVYAVDILLAQRAGHLSNKEVLSHGHSEPRVRLQ